MMSWKNCSFSQLLIGLQQIWILLTLGVSGFSAHSNRSPEFLGKMKDLTVVQGKDASFTCMVNNLGDHRIAWIKIDSKAILAINHTVITNNARLSVIMNDKVTWTLHIRSVQRRDNGSYMCQINTDPMKIQTATLSVVIPPDIISNETSGDLMIPEGGTAKLTCKAKGEPPPTITWMRERPEDLIIIREHQGLKRKAKEVVGEVLTLPKIVRSEMGAYLCIASNGVPPRVSKRVLIIVNFHPLIKVPTQMVAAKREENLTIECSSEASPKAINYWKRESGGEMIIANEKYRMIEEPTSQYGVLMKLQIRNISLRDYTGYKCISQNSMGSAEGTIHIYEYPSSANKADEMAGPTEVLPPDANEIRVEERHPSTRTPHQHHTEHRHPNNHHHHIETPRLSGEGNHCNKIDSPKLAPLIIFSVLSLFVSQILSTCFSFSWCFSLESILTNL